MQICTLASSSAGNSTLIQCGKSFFLIDAGISCRRIMSAVKNLGLSPSEWKGVLITHEHSDHISGLATLCRKVGVPVFAPAGVAEGILAAIPEAAPFLQTVPVGENWELGGAVVRAFHTPHDVRESVGYSVCHEGRRFTMATDMGHVSEEVLRALIGADTAMLEANHDTEMLKNGPYPFPLKKRILSDTGHLSNRMCGILAARLYREGTGRVILAHLSRENNTPELAMTTVEKAVMESGAIPGENFELLLAPRDVCGPLFRV